ncbi:hypothetical protein PIIN_08812 [Serendipita indica DSM 11827]|uniref:CCHC-type domain-containing protein n=1 Tax=Serendipita indica (strain DSM 11827) TaxID=1109443 RepID=G4TU50_SERID|nr:hypothetical protein PIIN_08812 [Serendipita indica DSM 11827]
MGLLTSGGELLAGHIFVQRWLDGSPWPAQGKGLGKLVSRARLWARLEDLYLMKKLDCLNELALKRLILARQTRRVIELLADSPEQLNALRNIAKGISESTRTDSRSPPGICHLMYGGQNAEVWTQQQPYKQEYTHLSADRPTEKEKEQEAGGIEVTMNGTGSGKAKRTEITARGSITGIDREVVYDYNTVVDHMKRKKWIIDGTTIMAVLMADIMMQQAEKPAVSQEIRNMLKAFAYALEHVSMDPLIDSYNKAVTGKLNGLIESAKQKLDKAIKTPTKFLDAVTTKCGEIVSTMTDLAKATKAMANAGTCISNINSTTTTTLAIDKAKATNIVNIHKWQIMVTTPSKVKKPSGIYTNGEVSSYKVKLNKVIEKRGNEGKNKWKIINLRHVQGGNTLLELSTPEAARWLRSGEEWREIVKEAFGVMDKSTKIVPRTYQLLVKFVPIGWSLHKEEALREFETKNSIPANSMQAARWIKDPARRYSGQEFANIKMICISPKVANRLILGPMRINNYVVKAQREQQTIPLCTKCSQFDHFIANCKADKFKCRFCAQEHKSRDCPNKANRKCTLCGSKNHTSGNKKCSAYKERMEKMERTDPEFYSAIFLTKEK